MHRIAFRGCLNFFFLPLGLFIVSPILIATENSKKDASTGCIFILAPSPALAIVSASGFWPVSLPIVAIVVFVFSLRTLRLSLRASPSGDVSLKKPLHSRCWNASLLARLFACVFFCVLFFFGLCCTRTLHSNKYVLCSSFSLRMLVRNVWDMASGVRPEQGRVAGEVERRNKRKREKRKRNK